MSGARLSSPGVRADAKIPFYVALLIAGLAVAVNLRYSGYVAILTDPSGYVSAGERWLTGNLHKAVPFQFQPQFPDFLNMGSPLAYRPGPIRGTDVGEYSLGLPLFVAAGMAAMGELGAYVIGPLFAGLLAWCTYGLGTALAGPWAGVLASLLISASPVTIRHSLYVSSDVPATACWALAWLMSLAPRPGSAAAAGAAVTAALMIRPNTAPLALIVGGLILLGGESPALSWRRWRWRHALAFTVMAAIGPAIVLWSNTVLYGGPLESGYKGAATFVEWAHVMPNLKLYPAGLVETHSVVAFAGFAAVPMALWRWRRSPDARRSLTVALSALSVIAVNLALYLPFFNYLQWTYLRYMLPAMVALFLLLSAVIVWVARRTAARWRLLAPLALVPAALVLWTGVPLVRDAMREWRNSASVLLMGHYLREALPPNAVVLCYMHSGSVAYYGGRPIVRLDLVHPHMDALIELLRVRGYRPLMVVDEVLEAEGLPSFFPASAYKELDWPPRATFTGLSRIWLMDPADRNLYQAGVTYPSDVLR